MNTLSAKLAIGFTLAAVFVCTQHAGGAGNVYDFDSLSSGLIKNQDNWSPVENLEVRPPNANGNTFYGNFPLPGVDKHLTMDYSGWATEANWRYNNDNWRYNLSEGGGATKFVMGAPWTTDYNPYEIESWQAEFRIWNGAEESQKGIGFGLESKKNYCAAYVDTAEGPNIHYDASSRSRHGAGHVLQTEGPWTGFTYGQRIDFRLEVDTAANDGEGGATLYTVRRYATTTWEAVPGLSNVDLQLATQSADIQNANGIIAVIGCRLVAMDSLIIAIPTGGPLTVKAFLDKDLDGVYENGPGVGSDELLTGFDLTIAGPYGGGTYGESPWDKTTDESGEVTVSQSRAGAPAGFDKLDDGTYKITDYVQCYYQASDPAVDITPDSGPITFLYGIRPEMGDANADGIVDGVDFTYLKANFGKSGMKWADANFSDDDMVDGVDFTYFKANFGKTHPEYVPPGSGVPEPATMLLLACGGIGLMLRRRR